MLNHLLLRKDMCHWSRGVQMRLVSGVSTYIGLYGSGLFNFGSYVSLSTLFPCFLDFDVPISSFIFIENVFFIIYK